MRKLSSITSYLLIAVMIFATSCEKSEITKEATSYDSADESFMSTTGNNDMNLENDNSVQGKQVLHVHFDKETTEIEASAIFKEKVNEYLNNQRVQSKGFSTEWFFRVRTKTGTQTDNETDGEVRVNSKFDTSVGSVRVTAKLDNPGNDREGGWDYYLVRGWYPQKAVQWVQTRGAYLELKGKDGWFVTNFDISIYRVDQSISSSGSSTIRSKPNVWLDNKSDNKWDRYDTGVVGRGRLTF